MPFIEYENENLPSRNLPYGFKSRLIELAPLNDAFKVSIACPEVKTLRQRRRRFYNHIYVTDDKRIRNIAMKESCENLDFQWLRYLADGPFTIDPTWQTVLLVDDIVCKNRPLYVNDTLVLDLKLVESYDRLVPLIVGPYSRLVLYGHFTWDQIKNLIHDNVKQVRIMNKIEVYQRDYNEVVKFMNSFGRGFVNKFSFINECFPPLLMKKLEGVCKNHKTHSLVNWQSPITHFIHNRYHLAFSITYVSVMCMKLFSFYRFYAFDGIIGDGTLSPYFAIIYIMCFPLHCIVFGLIANEFCEYGGTRPPKDVRVHFSQ